MVGGLKGTVAAMSGGTAKPHPRADERAAPPKAWLTDLDPVL